MVAWQWVCDTYKLPIGPNIVFGYNLDLFVVLGVGVLLALPPWSVPGRYAQGRVVGRSNQMSTPITKS